MTQAEKAYFKRIIYRNYKKQGRPFPWRDTSNPYRILVSEVMLQQTQAGTRTVLKYKTFLKKFPSVSTLAKASLSDVLRVWQGLGYNRRAKTLRDSAKIIVSEYGGVVPCSEDELMKLPGVGPYTAAAVCAFAFNKPTVFIETNIRAVYTHFFFCHRRTLIADSEIIPLIEETLSRKNLKVWYAALMDYGVYLKQEHRHLNKKSKHYTKQSTFKDSNRQIRGFILRELSQHARTEKVLARSSSFSINRIRKQALSLEREGLLEREGGRLSLAS